MERNAQKLQDYPQNYPLSQLPIVCMAYYTHYTHIYTTVCNIEKTDAILNSFIKITLSLHYYLTLKLFGRSLCEGNLAYIGPFQLCSLVMNKS